MLRNCFGYAWLTVVLLTFVHISTSGATGQSNSQIQPDSSIARIVDFDPPIHINHIDTTGVAIGQLLNARDSVEVPQKSSLTIMWRNGSLQRFEGPAALSFANGKPQSSPGQIAKLASLVAGLFFSKQEPPEARLGVRGLPADAHPDINIPIINFPCTNSALREPPEQLSWTPLSGISEYSVSVFNDTSLVWRSENSQPPLSLPNDTPVVKAGERYVWYVEARVGHIKLRSEQALFRILDSTEKGSLQDQESSIKNTIADIRLQRLMLAELYRSYGLFDESLAQINKFDGVNKINFAIMLFKAELLESMGQYQKAAETYRLAALQR